MSVPRCTAAGCNGKVLRGFDDVGLCKTHARAQRTHQYIPLAVPKVVLGTCAHDECNRIQRSRYVDYCENHQYRVDQYGDPDGGQPYRPRAAVRGTCSEDNCSAPEHARGFCSLHYHRRKRSGAFATREEVTV